MKNCKKLRSRKKSRKNQEKGLIEEKNRPKSREQKKIKRN